MTRREFNTVGAAAYEAAMRIPEIANKLNGPEDIAYVFILQDGNYKRYVVLNHHEQNNSRLCRNTGFNPETTVYSFQFAVNRKTKSVYF